MEQYLHYLMRIKSNNIYTHTSRPSHFNHFTSIQSWEEQAFAEDIGEGRPLGGFVWPPRCYSCNFCERTFKSAQALGGHMNVHRRDRARLNQPHCLNTDGASKISIPADSSNPSDVLSSYFYSNVESVRIIQGDLVTKKLACMNNILSKDSTVETGLSVGLNFYVSKNREAEHAGDGGDIKRRRTDGGSQVPLLYVACSSGDKEIDLELRLGESPTVN